MAVPVAAALSGSVCYGGEGGGESLRSPNALFSFDAAPIVAPIFAKSKAFVDRV